jgi:hypothetical protein
VILQGLGPQSEEDLSFISSNHAIQYVKDLEGKKDELPDLKKKCLEIRSKLGEKYREIVDVL